MDHSLLPPPTGAINHRSPKSRHSSCLSTTLLLLTFAFSLAALIVAIDIRKKTHENLNDLNAVKQNVASMASNVVPKSFVAPSLPPRKYQYTRGTCWDFGTVGPIEHQYRLQGIANGWLAPNQYVKLSEQAFGNRILQYCKENQQYCLIAGDNVAFGSTEGGETTLLYAFRQQFENTVLPDGVCPYIQDKDDSSCPAIDAALKTNPIKFTISSFTTLYNVDDIKQAIATKKYAMPFSTPVWTVSYWLPCNDKYAKNDPKCTTPSLLTPCPAEVDSNGATSCLKIEAPFNTMDGEFRSRHAMDLEAGHAMTLVGYNDNFVTKDGFKGGFIMRNTWVDGVYSFDEFHTARARGSHSIAYFMNWISENDEKLLCPNSYNPRSWITCGAGDTTAAKVSDCMSDNNNKAAVAQLSPLLLICSTHSTACDHSYNKWWAANFTEYFDSLFIACFIGAKTNGNTIVSTTEICLPPQPMDTIATIFNPDTSNIYPNSDDFCGYYFYPYGVYEEAKATFSSGFVNDYQLDFHPQSYAANANQYAAANGIDYYFIHNSTHQQNILPTGADLPNPYPSGPNPYPNNKNDDNHHLITMRASIQQYVRQQKITRRHK